MAKKEKKNVAKKGYFQEISEELKKVQWPERNTMVKYTLAVLVFILIFGVYFYGLDALFAWIKEFFN